MPRPVRISTRSRNGAKWRSSPAVSRLLGLSPATGRAKPKTEEHDAQTALFRDHIVPRLAADAVAFAIPNGGHRAKREAAKIKEEGGASGVPDIFAIRAGQAFFLEMKKAKGGVVSKEQRAMMARLTAAGAVCAVANGLAEAIEVLEAWGLLTTTATATATEEMAA